jgi:catechol 2,3-dioxygenase-like lactoylglutathione lyase family enzyme
VALLLVLRASTLPAQIHPSGVGPIVITVSDLDRSVEFYTDVLSFQKEFVREARSDSFDRLVGLFGTNVRVAGLKLGAETIELVEFRTPQGRPIPADSHSDDRWFQHIAIVVRDMDAASSRLRAHKVKQISTAPQILPAWNPNAAGIKAFYFYDPDDHPLELISFPLDKGDPRWRQVGLDSTLFLGIDHTAIAVKDTDRSVAFYRDLLGFRVVGESLNYGPEQEQLNHVFGSRVLITSLRAPSGPGIEFLEYVTPQTGRAFPAETQADDLWSIDTTVRTADLPAAVAELRKRKITFVSSEPAEVAPLSDTSARGVLIRDPDGHGLLLRSPD